MLFAVGHICIGTQHSWSLASNSWVTVTQGKFSDRYAWNPMLALYQAPKSKGSYMQCSTPEPQTPQGLTLHHASAGPQPGSPGADMHNATPSLAPINRACLYSARALQHAGLAWAPVISGVKHPSAYDS